MLNEGIRTDVVGFVTAVTDPDATATEIVDAMRMPPDAAVEQLLLDELRTIDSPLDEWSDAAGIDMREVFLRNSACKRVLYVSAPMFLPDVIEVPVFQPKGVNTRVHVFPAPDVWDTVRLEAVSSYTVREMRFRYALSIQYVTDSAGLGWQLIRPVVVLDRPLLRATRRGGPAAEAALDRLLEALRRIVLMGSHDYVHATVLNWFPPLTNLAPEYAAIVSERPHPKELDAWHVDALTPLPAGFVDAMPTPGIASLELYSLKVHAQVVRQLWESDGGRTRDYARDLLAEFDAALTAFVGAADLGDDEKRDAVAEYFAILGGWFVVSAFPIGSAELTDVLARLSGDRAERALRHLRAVHESMFDYVRFVDAGHYPWGERVVTLHDVGTEYATALRAPTLREHLRYLTAAGADGRSWLDRVCDGVAEPHRAAAEAAFRDALDADAATLAGLRDLLVDNGTWHELHRAAGAADGAGGGPTAAGHARRDYASRALRSALDIMAELAQRRETAAAH